MNPTNTPQTFWRVSNQRNLQEKNPKSFRAACQGFRFLIYFPMPHALCSLRSLGSCSLLFFVSPLRSRDLRLTVSHLFPYALCPLLYAFFLSPRNLPYFQVPPRICRKVQWSKRFFGSEGRYEKIPFFVSSLFSACSS